MNRIIIIGNGFDLAHNLKTGYKDFIDDYWNTVREKVYGGYRQWLDQQYGMSPLLDNCEDDFVNIKTIYGKGDAPQESFLPEEDSPLRDLCTLIERYNNNPNINAKVYLKFKNLFFERISKQCSFVNWVDIENEYYNALKELLQEENPQKQNESIRTLNKEFNSVKGLLEEYLTKITENTELKKHQSIQNAFLSSVEYSEIATCKQTIFVDSIFAEMNAYSVSEFEIEKKKSFLQYMPRLEDEKRKLFVEERANDECFKKKYLTPRTLILNFNYTKTAENLYTKNGNDEIINIHGELNNESNPIIFGYGDELDDDYKRIERLQNNDFLENIKSIRYHKTKNYRSLLEFIALGPYQIFIMGHSCGNSDRTLLNTLFEHDNCLSIKVFYRQYEDGIDNYIDLIKNISRNFNNKPNMRDIVVNRESCSPLVPVKKEAAIKPPSSILSST